MKVEQEPVGLETATLPRTGSGLPLARGIYHRPAGRRPRIAFIAAHFDLDFSQHFLANLLARAGFGFLGWNTRYCGRGAHFLLDRALVDIGLGVTWLRQQGAEAIVLVGNSGGGSLLAAYYAQTRESVVRAPYAAPIADGLDDLPAGELYVSLAAHLSRPEVLTNWLDPAVVDERDPLDTDPELDMYSGRHGPPYAQQFVERYRSAQQDRNQRITAWCHTELERLKRAGYRDRLFTVARTWADLRFLDPSLDPSDRPTPGCYLGDPQRANRGIEGIGMVNSLRTWLGMWSLADRQCDPATALGLIDVPALVIQARADTGVFPSDARGILQGLAADDKQLIEMEGDHYFRGPNGSSAPREAVATLIADWVEARTS